MNSDWLNRYETAIEAAQQAGRLALAHFDQGIRVDYKSDRSPVTEADREAERYLRTTLKSRFPNDAVLGEEFGEEPGDSGFRWIIDPIDGTKSFVRNIPLWATLVGLEYKGEQIAGVACAPAMGNTVYRAVLGDGAFRNDRPIRVSNVDRLADAQLFYSSVSWFSRAGKEREFLKLALSTQRQRGFGDFYGFVLVAQGSGEIMAEHGISCWDVAALKPILEEAGGKLTNWANEPTIHSPDVIATNAKLHQAALDVLTGVK